MSFDERMRNQNDPNLEAIADLQRSITATLTYIMGRASVAELFGLQAYLSTLASQMAPVEREETALGDSARHAQMFEAQQRRYQQALSNCTPAQYRQEG